jgi:hypothetical protein
MRWMKSGSIGEMPPSTRFTSGLTLSIAFAASITVRPNSDQSGSTSGSQCDLLLGSFQIIAASSIQSIFPCFG